MPQRTPTTDPAVISYLFPSLSPSPSPSPTPRVFPPDYPLGPFDPRYDPDALIANTDRPTAEQLGWVKTEGYGSLRRYHTLRSLTSIEKEVQVLRLVRQNMRNVDIAVELGIATTTVAAITKRALKRAVVYAGAEKERDHQLEITGRVMERLMATIDPGPDETGHEPRVDTKAVSELMKVLNRRASLTGADQPTRVHLNGQVAHTVSAADDTVNKVNSYMDLMDRLIDTGYGSGRKREEATIINAEAEEIEPAEEDRIVDAEVVEPDLIVPSDASFSDTENTPIPENDSEPLHPLTPPTLHSVPNDGDPGGQHN